nr:hypothetical protein [Candidatus Sigynarchaeota archaeon]
MSIGGLIGSLIGAGIRAAKQVHDAKSAQLEQEQMKIAFVEGLSGQASTLFEELARKFQDLGIDIDNVDTTLPAYLSQQNQDMRDFVIIMYSALIMSQWMTVSSKIIAAGTVNEWLHDNTYPLPPGMVMQGFIYVLENYPVIGLVMQQILYTGLCTLEQMGYAHVTWRSVALNPYFRKALAVESPSEIIRASWIGGNDSVVNENQMDDMQIQGMLLLFRSGGNLVVRMQGPPDPLKLSF